MPGKSSSTAKAHQVPSGWGGLASIGVEDEEVEETRREPAPAPKRAQAVAAKAVDGTGSRGSSSTTASPTLPVPPSPEQSPGEKSTKSKTAPGSAAQPPAPKPKSNAGPAAKSAGTGGKSTPVALGALQEHNRPAGKKGKKERQLTEDQKWVQSKCMRLMRLRDIKELYPSNFGGLLFGIVGFFLGLLEYWYHYVVVVHEGGHYLAAGLVGHPVEEFQTDFVDRLNNGDYMADELATKVGLERNGAYSQDGKNGFVLYAPTEEVEVQKIFVNDTDYESWRLTQPNESQFPPMANVVIPPREQEGEEPAVTKVQLNETHWVEYFQGSQNPPAFQMAVWRDLTNKFGRYLGKEGTELFKAIAGPCFDVLVCVLLLLTSGICFGFGKFFSRFGFFFGAGGIVILACRAEYAVQSCLTPDVGGDYVKVAASVHALTGFNEAWFRWAMAAAFIGVPVSVWLMGFFYASRRRLRRVDDVHVRMFLMDRDWCEMSRLSEKAMEIRKELITRATLVTWRKYKRLVRQNMLLQDRIKEIVKKTKGNQRARAAQIMSVQSAFNARYSKKMGRMAEMFWNQTGKEAGKTYKLRMLINIVKKTIASQTSPSSREVAKVVKNSGKHTAMPDIKPNKKAKANGNPLASGSGINPPAEETAQEIAEKERAIDGKNDPPFAKLRQLLYMQWWKPNSPILVPGNALWTISRVSPGAAERIKARLRSARKAKKDAREKGQGMSRREIYEIVDPALCAAEDAIRSIGANAEMMRRPHPWWWWMAHWAFMVCWLAVASADYHDKIPEPVLDWILYVGAGLQVIPAVRWIIYMWKQWALLTPGIKALQFTYGFTMTALSAVLIAGTFAVNYEALAIGAAATAPFIAAYFTYRIAMQQRISLILHARAKFSPSWFEHCSHASDFIFLSGKVRRRAPVTEDEVARLRRLAPSAPLFKQWISDAKEARIRGLLYPAQIAALEEAQRGLGRTYEIGEDGQVVAHSQDEATPALAGAKKRSQAGSVGVGAQRAYMESRLQDDEDEAHADVEAPGQRVARRASRQVSNIMMADIAEDSDDSDASSDDDGGEISAERRAAIARARENRMSKLHTMRGRGRTRDGGEGDGDEAADVEGVTALLDGLKKEELEGLNDDEIDALAAPASDKHATIRRTARAASMRGQLDMIRKLQEQEEEEDDDEAAALAAAAADMDNDYMMARGLGGALKKQAFGRRVAQSVMSAAVADVSIFKGKKRDDDDDYDDDTASEAGDFLDPAPPPKPRSGRFGSKRQRSTAKSAPPAVSGGAQRTALSDVEWGAATTPKK